MAPKASIFRFHRWWELLEWKPRTHIMDKSLRFWARDGGCKRHFRSSDATSNRRRSFFQML